MAARYTVESAGDIALVAATAKSVLSFVGASAAPFRLIELCVAFDGVTSTAVPGLVELCSSTQAGAGTSTSHTILQSGGATRTVQGTGKRNYTVEPTVLTTLKRWRVRADGGMLVLQFPLGREPEQVTSAAALIIRCTFAAVVNFQGYIEIEEG